MYRVVVAHPKVKWLKILSLVADRISGGDAAATLSEIPHKVVPRIFFRFFLDHPALDTLQNGELLRWMIPSNALAFYILPHVGTGSLQAASA